MWIRKNPDLKWKFAKPINENEEYSDYITAAQFHEACIDLANDLKEEGGLEPDGFGYPKGAKFRVLDLR